MHVAPKNRCQDYRKCMNINWKTWYALIEYSMKPINNHKKINTLKNLKINSYVY